jgi:uncharacterized repeat protein (TIGR01451 family)
VQVAGLRRRSGGGSRRSHGCWNTAQALAVKRDGTVWAWGFNEFGRLDRSKPVRLIQPGLPDLAIAMSHRGDFTVGDFTIGDLGLYTLKIVNDGWTATAGTVTVTDKLPPGLTYLSAGGGGWNCSFADDTITCTNATSINPGASSTVTLTVRVEAPAWPVTNLATVTNQSDANLGTTSLVIRRCCADNEPSNLRCGWGPTRLAGEAEGGTLAVLGDPPRTDPWRKSNPPAPRAHAAGWLLGMTSV